MLEVAEDQVRRQTSSSATNSIIGAPTNSASGDTATQVYGEIVSADVPLYIVSKLGLNKNALIGKFFRLRVPVNLFLRQHPIWFFLQCFTGNQNVIIIITLIIIIQR